ncbi:MAG: hypothetical protein ACK4N5_10400 [Myxococcales bacterium]
MSGRDPIDLVIDPNPNCPEGGDARFVPEDAPRPVRAVRYWSGPEEHVECDVQGWSSAGGGSAVPAFGITVLDSGEGTAVVVYGGDWGVRLVPRDGRPAFGEPYLRIDAADVLEQG